MASEDEDEVPSTGGARTFWSGTITFGLVSVPVALLAANRPRGGVSLRMVSDEGAPLQRRYVCSKDGQELNWDDIVRGYEVEKGKFVVVTDEELEAIAPRKSREIDLRLFVPAEEIDPVYFERAYFLVPAGGATKAYRLLAAVMEESGRAGIATFVMRAKEYVVAILSENGILRAETLRFHDEIRSPADVGLPKVEKPSPASVKKFEGAIAKHTGKMNLRDFEDDYAQKLEALARKKNKLGRDVVDAPADEAETDEGGGEVIDLMEALRKSLGGSHPSKRRPAKRAPAKRSAAKRPAAKKATKRK